MEFNGKSASSSAKRSDVDMTSMVDVTFLLLIFFMVTASFNLQKSIEMPPQRTEDAGNPDDQPEASVHLQVDHHGSFLVMAPDWELETPGKQNLIAALLRASEESDQALELSVEVHESARLEALVAALDAGATAGFVSIRVSQFDHL